MRLVFWSALCGLAMVPDPARAENAAAETSHKIYVTPFFSVPILQLTLEAPKHDDAPDVPDVSYEPTVRPDLGLRVAYDDFGLSFSVLIKSHDDSSQAAFILNSMAS